MKQTIKDYAVIVAAVLAMLALVAGVVVYNQWAYGDWTCVVKTCVQVKK